MTSFSIAPIANGNNEWDGNFTFKFYIFLVHDGAPNYCRSEAAGVFTLMALNFFLFGITIMALGVIGEYTGVFISKFSKDRII